MVPKATESEGYYPKLDKAFVDPPAPPSRGSRECEASRKINVETANVTEALWQTMEANSGPWIHKPPDDPSHQRPGINGSKGSRSREPNGVDAVEIKVDFARKPFHACMINGVTHQCQKWLALFPSLAVIFIF